HRDPHGGGTRQALFRGRREQRHEAGRGRLGHRRDLARDGALRRAAADPVQLRQLRPAALRDQRARRGRDGLRRRRGHRPGPHRILPQVLLFRRQRHPAHHHRHRHDHRPCDGAAAPCADRHGAPLMNGPARTAARFEAEALADMAGLAARHPSIFRVNWPLRALVVTIVAVLAGLFLWGFWALGFSFARIAGGLGKLVEFAGFMLPPSPGSYTTFLSYLDALAQTLAIAFLGTLTAAILAFPFGFLAAKNVIPNVFLHFSLRRGLDVVRGVDVLIWALIWFNVVGLGPFAGILAVATSNFGEFGKLFAEAIEAMDKKAVEGVASTGGGKLHQVRFGLLPQVFPVIV